LLPVLNVLHLQLVELRADAVQAAAVPLLALFIARSRVLDLQKRPDKLNKLPLCFGLLAVVASPACLWTQRVFALYMPNIAYIYP
jgi:hypothetical protein